MKIVLLPGLDGTGELFKPLLDYLPKENTMVISLPTTDEQSYCVLTKYCQEKMPNEKYILVAESFSGPIGLAIAASNPVNLERLILVATFAHPPKPLIAKLCSLLPIKLLIRLPFANLATRFLFLGLNSSKEVSKQFFSSITKIPANVLAKRLKVAASFKQDIDSIKTPVIYIQPTYDSMVPKSCYAGVAKICQNITKEEVFGSHFILQTKPKRCSEIIIANFK